MYSYFRDCGKALAATSVVLVGIAVCPAISQTPDPRQQQLAQCIQTELANLTSSKRINSSSPQKGLYVSCDSPTGVFGCDNEADWWVGYKIPELTPLYHLDVGGIAWHEDENDNGEFKGLRVTTNNTMIQAHLYCEVTTCYGAGKSIGGHVSYSLIYTPTIDDKRRAAGTCLSK